MSSVQQITRRLLPLRAARIDVKKPGFSYFPPIRKARAPGASARRAPARRALVPRVPAPSQVQRAIGPSSAFLAAPSTGPASVLDSANYRDALSGSSGAPSGAPPILIEKRGNPLSSKTANRCQAVTVPSSSSLDISQAVERDRSAPSSPSELEDPLFQRNANISQAVSRTDTSQSLPPVTALRSCLKGSRQRQPNQLARELAVHFKLYLDTRNLEPLTAEDLADADHVELRCFEKTSRPDVFLSHKIELFTHKSRYAPEDAFVYKACHTSSPRQSSAIVLGLTTKLRGLSQYKAQSDTGAIVMTGARHYQIRDARTRLQPQPARSFSLSKKRKVLADRGTVDAMHPAKEAHIDCPACKTVRETGSIATGHFKPRCNLHEIRRAWISHDIRLGSFRDKVFLKKQDIFWTTGQNRLYDVTFPTWYGCRKWKGKDSPEPKEYQGLREEDLLEEKIWKDEDVD